MLSASSGIYGIVVTGFLYRQFYYQPIRARAYYSMRFPKPSPSEGLGAARAATERAVVTVIVSPKTPMTFKAHTWPMKNLASTKVFHGKVNIRQLNCISRCKCYEKQKKSFEPLSVHWGLLFNGLYFDIDSFFICFESPNQLITFL